MSGRGRSAAALAVPGVLAFTVPLVGFVATLLLPVAARQARTALWPHVRPTASLLWAVAALTGLWWPAVLALVTNGSLGAEANVWLVLPLCAPAGAAMLAPAACALTVYLAGVGASAVLRSPLTWVLGAWVAPLAYWAASSWLVEFSCFA